MSKCVYKLEGSFRAFLFAAVTAKSPKAMRELLAFSCRGWHSCHPLLACSNAFEMEVKAANILYFAHTDNSGNHVLACEGRKWPSQEIIMYSFQLL